MKSIRATVLFIQSLVFYLVFGLTAEGAILISVNNSGPFGDDSPINTFDFTLAQQVNTFLPDGAAVVTSSGGATGRALAIQSNEVFYTEVFGTSPSPIFGPSDGIHVAPYGTAGYGGHDLRVLPNPRTNSGIQGLAFHNRELYVLTGYATNQLEVFELDPTTGSVISGPISIGLPAQPDSDGFVVLTNGNFLINDGDASTTNREYNGTTGSLVSGGLEIDLSAFGFTNGTGACLAPDSQSFYFCANFGTLIQVDLTGAHLLASALVGGSQFEELAVVETPSCSIYPRFPSIDSSNFSFAVFGTPSTVWSVYSSTDLTNWTYITNLTTGTGPAGFADSTISGVPYRFYKLSDSNCCSQAIGFVRILVGAGPTNSPGTNSLLANQLDSLPPAGNTLDGLFNVSRSGLMPDGTALIDGSEIQKWDFASQTFLYYRWHSSSGWSDLSGNPAGSVSLDPGEGAFLATSNDTTVTFVGLVREGRLDTPLSQTGEYYLLSVKVPKAGGLQTGLNYFPHSGDLVDLWKGSGLGYFSTTYFSLAGGFWSQGEPILKVGQAFFWRGGATNNWQMNFSPCQ